MAIRDVRNFNFLKEAIVQRFRNPDLKSYKGIPYEPQTNPHSIFGRLYSTFRQLNGKGLNLHQYLNIEERGVLENLYQNLQNDLNLKFLNQPEAALNDPRLELSDEHYQEETNQPETASEQMASTGDSTAGGGMPYTGMPSGGSYASRSPRIIYQIPEEKSKLVTTDRYGNIKETPGPSKLVIADKSGNVVGEHTVGPQSSIPQSPGPEARPKLVMAGKSGAPIEPGKTGLSLADRHDRIISGPGAEAKPTKILTANDRGIVTGVRNIQSPSWLKAFGSDSKIFANRNLPKIFDGLKGIGGGVGNGLLNAASGGTTGVYNLGKGMGNRALNAGANAGNRYSRFRKRTRALSRSASQNLKKSFGRKAAIGGFIGFFSIAFLTGMSGAGAPGGGTSGPTVPIPIPGGAPSSNISSCKFMRSGDTTKELTYKSPLLLSYIQEASNITGIPPVVLAAFIRVETPSTVVKNDDEIRNLSSVATCPKSKTGALGVMQLQPKGTTGHDEGAITNGAKLIGKNYDQLTEEDYCDVRKNIIMGAGFILKKMTYKTPDFPKTYGDGTKWDPVWTKDKEAIRKLVNGYYGCLVYGGADPTKCEGPFNYGDDVWASIQNCQAPGGGVGPGTGVASCPVPGGIISTPSYQAGQLSGKKNGHCDGGYAYTCKCDTTGRRAKAIDVSTNGKNVVLPTINGQSVNWTLITGPYDVSGGEGGGVGYTFQAISGTDIWYLDMLHLNLSDLKPILSGGISYPSGTAVATTFIDHVHMTIGKNLSKPPVAASDTDCDQNWLPSDFMCP